MSWFCAHAILYVRFKEGEQSSFPIWENIYLIEASTPDDAMILAEARAHEDEGDSDNGFTWENHPAEWVFAGIRKLISVSHQLQTEVPASGDELTYSEYEAESMDIVHDFAKGNPVQLYLSD